MYSRAQRDQMLDLATESIRSTLTSGKRYHPRTLPAFLRHPGCSFVTLRRDGQLLGCIGALQPYQPLGVDIVEHAYAAAFEDPRFPPLAELTGVHVEISVLGPLREFPATSYDDVVARLPRTGAVVEGHGQRGTFLPDVWEQMSNRSQFVASLWRKAGLPPGTWPVQVWTYDVEDFGRVVTGSR